MKISTMHCRNLLALLVANNSKPSRYFGADGDFHFFCNEYGRIVWQDLKTESFVEMSDNESLPFKTEHSPYFDINLEGTVRSYIAGDSIIDSLTAEISIEQICILLDVIDANNSTPSRFYQSENSCYFILNEFGRVVILTLNPYEIKIMDDAASSKYKASHIPCFNQKMETGLRELITTLI